MDNELADSASVPPFKGPPKPPLPPHLIAHKSSQTGDTLHVAATLALFDFVDVIVIHVGNIGSTEGLLNFYRQATDKNYPDAAISPNSAASNKRVKVVYAASEAAADALYTTLSWVKASDETTQKDFPTILTAGALFSETSSVGTTPPALRQINTFDEFKTTYLKNKIGGTYQYMGNLGQTTSAIAEKFRNSTSELQKTLYTTLANKLTARDVKSVDIIKGTSKEPTFGQRTLPDANPSTKPVVLLWARYTGTNTAISHNAEGDSCIQGQVQLNHVLKSNGLDVVTIGHGPRGGHPFAADHDVGEFYKEANTPISGARATQQSFFLALMEKYPGRLYQIGQKTGGMDGGALLGIPTIYLEHESSPQIRRMKKWSDGSLPFYQGVIMEEPVPAVARAQKAQLPASDLYGAWKGSSDPILRARARLAAMLYAFPKQMGGKPEWSLARVAEKSLDKRSAFERKKVKSDKFAGIVAFVKSLSDADVQEDRNNPALDGQWTKKVQAVNQDPNLVSEAEDSDNIGEAAGYSKVDLVTIGKAMQTLIHDYSSEKQAVVRTASGAYRTREEAKLF